MNMNIINDSGEKKSGGEKKLKVVTCILVAALVVGGAGFGIWSLSKPKPQKADDGFEDAKKIYEDVGIEYTREDYEKDKAAKEASSKAGSEEDKSDGSGSLPGESEAAKALNDYNQTLLDAKEQEAGFKSDTQKVEGDIINRIGMMRDFIDDEFGWSKADGYGDEYDTSRSFQAALFDGLCGNGWPESYNMDISSQEMGRSLRYSIFNLFQYKNTYDGYDQVLDGWFKAGAPRITSISSIGLEEGNWDTIDGFPCTMKAHCVTDAGTCTVLLTSSLFDDGGEWSVLDIIF